MTRINLVPPSELCDQHLLSEHRELTRIPNSIASGRYKNFDNIPKTYRLGEGHVRFFLDKLMFLSLRYIELHKECIARGFNISWRWPIGLTDAVFGDIWYNYTPTQEALAINRARIVERMPAKARFTTYQEAKKCHK